MMLRVAGALALLFAIPGCHGTPPESASAQPASLTPDKALYAAEAAYAAGASALEAAVDQGLLKGAAAARAQDLLVQAHDALLR